MPAVASSSERQLAVSEVGGDGSALSPCAVADDRLGLETSLKIANSQLAEANRKLVTVRKDGPFTHD